MKTFSCTTFSECSECSDNEPVNRLCPNQSSSRSPVGADDPPHSVSRRLPSFLAAPGRNTLTPLTVESIHQRSGRRLPRLAPAAIVELITSLGLCFQNEGQAPLWFTHTVNDRLWFVWYNDAARQGWANRCCSTSGVRAMNRWQTSR